ALGVGEGKEVVVPAYVCTALLNAINYTGADPVLADIDPRTFNLDPEEVGTRLTQRTAAIIVPHLFGRPADMNAFEELGPPIIEDCAQAIGGAYQGRPVGSFGRLSIFSFYATKVITTAEGGMVVGDDPELISSVRDLKEYGQPPDGRVRYNYKMSDLSGAMGLVQLGRLPEFIAKRRALAARYAENLEGLDLIRPRDDTESGHIKEHIFYRYVVRVKREKVDPVIRFLDSAGIAAARPVFRTLASCLGQADEFPGTKEAFETALSLPIYPELTLPLVDRVSEQLALALERA
ncbi:MAG: DegT/DnrJ/EryC1/StrS family aminotransferase, partial [Deltaproteobacteria bacterium]|nr:DegT/DnrJ/EryC1/StrS family aminotransferase [Deltaproteobacteria bacterium]